MKLLEEALPARVLVAVHSARNFSLLTTGMQYVLAALLGLRIARPFERWNGSLA